MRRRLAALASWSTCLASTCLAATVAQAATGCPSAEAIAPGVYLVAGRDGEPSPANAGEVVNRIFLTGPQGVTIIDPGPTPAGGLALRCTIDRTIGPTSRLSVAAVILTHPHPENVLAATVFPEATIYASRQAAEAMASRCERCQKHLATLIDQPALGELPPPRPNHPITGRQTITAGGRVLELIPVGAAHSPGDLAVLDKASGLLIGGDVVNVDALPDLHDGHIPAWRDALSTLAGEPAVAAVVPGRGRPFLPARLAEPLRYLDALWQLARQRVETPDGFVPPSTLPAPLQAFPGDPTRHALNLQHALREAEDAWWLQAAPGTPR